MSRNSARRDCRGLALLALLLSLPAFADEAGYSLDELLAKLRTHAQRHANFTERYTTRLLDRPLDAAGELFYEAPDHLEKRTLRPRPERLVLDKGTLMIERKHRTLTTTLAAYPDAAPYIDSIRATLAGDRPALERVFHVEFAGTAPAWTLTLAPLAAVSAAKVKSIRIAGGGDEIETVRIDLANGDSTVMTLSNATGD